MSRGKDNAKQSHRSGSQPPAASSRKPKAPKLDSKTLASIAAQVAPKRFEKSKDAVNFAYQLWEDSKELLSHDDALQAWAVAQDKEAEAATLPKHAGPYYLKEFLNNVVGGDIKNQKERF